MKSINKFFVLVAVILLCFEAGIYAQPKLKRICSSKSGQNTVYWFPFNTSCEAFLQTYIYGRENNSSPFSLIDSVSSNQTTYFHNSASFQRGSYFIICRAVCNGIITKFISDTLLVDVIPPAVVEPDSVSVGVDGEIIIGWNAASADDTKSYVIYRMLGSNNFPVDTVYGRTNTFYYNNVHGNPEVNTERFRIASVDSCDNIAPMGNFHETIFTKISQDFCKRTVSLNWTAYNGWPEGVLRYDIYVSTNKYSGYTKSASVTNDLNIELYDLANHTDYYFFVRAVRNGKEFITSSSNRVLLKTDFDDVLEYIYLANVSFVIDEVNFINQNKIKVEWLVSNSSNMDRYEIWRGKAPLSVKKIATVIATTDTSYFYEDAYMGEPQILYYYVVAYSKCGNYAGTSNTSRTIVAQFSVNENGRELTWNNYEVWNAGVESYYVNRRFVNNGIDYTATQLSPFALNFFDSDSIVSQASPGVCYYISGVENTGNIYGYTGKSNSNVVCYTDSPYVFIPNAFYPGGINNKIFRPVILNVDTIQSKLNIYNRWGQAVVQNEAVVKGWDGNSESGNKCPEGVYFYVINIVGTDGSIKLYKGTVTLL